MDKFTLPGEDKLEDALALLAAGMPLAEILADAGEDADWLRPLLEVAAEVGEFRSTLPIPSPEASLQRMLTYGQELKAASPPAAPVRSDWSTMLARLFSNWLPRLATGLVSAMLVIVLLSSTLTVLAQRSLPGQPLYGLKRIGETLRLSLAFDPSQQAQLLENYNQRRQMETRLLLEQKQVAQVDFFGQVEAVTETSVTVDGLIIQRTPETKMSGNVATGARVKVEVLTQPPDQLLALAITVVEPALPTPTPLPPTATLTPTPTATAIPTLSRSSATDTLRLPTVTPTPLPTSTPTIPPPSPTATLLPPTATLFIPPTGGDDNGSTNENSNNSPGDNNNGNDNSGDNSGSGGDDSGSGNDNGGGDDNSGSGSEDSGSSGNSGSGGGDSDSSSGGGGGSGDSSGSGGGD
ncbi:MAG TPA: DUF5667 domain-containing protein [Anaerolineae bacterium]|nr:DUF5667 domain-containing protein [Anaerolineae bacterium]